MSARKTKEIAYEIVRSPRTTADIVVERDGRVTVRAPDHLSDERVEDIVEAKRYWIYKTLAEWRDLNARRVLREYRNGEGFLYLGRSHRLLLVAEQEEPLMLKGGRFCLRRDVVDNGDIAAAQSAFRDYYIARGLERIAERVNYYAPKVGVKPAGFDVRELGHRWASCSPAGRLAFHWKCMMAPQTIIDYIVVHELCHFHHLDHTDAFWNEVDKIMPVYRERKEWSRIDRRKCGLFTHDATLYSVFVPGLKKAEFEQLDEVFGQRLFKALLWDGFPQAQIKRMLEACRVMRFTRSSNRSVLGSMNDIRFHIGWHVKDGSGLTGVDLARLHHRLNRIPFSAVGYGYPVERLREYLED